MAQLPNVDQCHLVVRIDLPKLYARDLTVILVRDPIQRIENRFHVIVDIGFLIAPRFVLWQRLWFSNR
jgi:hypothetical protein